MKGIVGRIVVVLLAAAPVAGAVDENSNGQSDVWEMLFQFSGLPAAGDFDADGWSNAAESGAGTDPRSAASHPDMEMALVAGLPTVSWQGLKGKHYVLLASDSLTSFAPTGDVAAGTGGEMHFQLPPADGSGFFRMAISDVDSDGDLVSDWEEFALGFDPFREHTDRHPGTDAERVVAGLSATSTVSVSVYDDGCSERWPDPAVFVLRRADGLRPLKVDFTLGGTAVGDVDYQKSIAGTSVDFAAGQREAFVEIKPLPDALDAEPIETVTLTVNPGAAYTVGSANAATVSILNQPEGGGPYAKEAARFLIQAAFGPDQDAADDADHIPENVEEVMATGISGWIDEQLTRPVGHLVPMVRWQTEQQQAYINEETDIDPEIYNDRKQNAWWGRAMGLPKLRPDSTTTQLADPLRQRVGFALSQIFVISDRMERIGVQAEGMADFYDTLLDHSFGNYRNLLHDVSLHPCMGIYLSHMGNKKADPEAHTFPDENYAREVMQLFSIGLWMLNPDGSRQLDTNGQPVPTYNNATITELARVFTGLSFGRKNNGTDNDNFGEYEGDFTSLMKGFDEHHDLAPKTLLLGVTTPQRVADDGQATAADVDALMDNLFNHPNVGPFIGRQLIQRLVTSNPSPAYISRVTAAFNAAPRGDMGRTVKAILMDPEARDPARMDDPTYGKLREPFLRTVNVARAFNASSPDGWYYLDAFSLDHVQEPMKSPSVFNFYLPGYSPPGLLAQAGLVSPELQIVNASSGTTAPNYFWRILDGLHRWGASASKNVRLNIDQEMLLNVPAEAVDDPEPDVEPLDPDALIRRLDLVLTGGTLSPDSFQIIREALNRIGPGSGWDWPRNRLKLAIYLIVSSPEFSVQK
ncbi:DUF1800 family protein [Luteolibacter yonseiensis]|uniref:DUF1800 family protein n=1 Tax=Luteolibacter yonseiensis TaxID=1144680 RepID=A0A934V9K9_9BACT|nr:DUF1800 family protein [Luteolibacter yonseiensis]MBK1815258.1 DUF1800 family protein [Luteolibacter yonseiensis]